MYIIYVSWIQEIILHADFRIIDYNNPHSREGFSFRSKYKNIRYWELSQYSTIDYEEIKEKVNEYNKLIRQKIEKAKLAKIKSKEEQRQKDLEEFYRLKKKLGL